jgi:hypothetical protein
MEFETALVRREGREEKRLLPYDVAYEMNLEKLRKKGQRGKFYN